MNLSQTFSACYWSGIIDKGIGSGSGETTKFGTAPNWPTDDSAKNWGIGSDPATGKYWKSLGSYSETYPKLYWED